MQEEPEDHAVTTHVVAEQTSVPKEATGATLADVLSELKEQGKRLDAIEQWLAAIESAAEETAEEVQNLDDDESDSGDEGEDSPESEHGEHSGEHEREHDRPPAEHHWYFRKLGR